MSHLKHLPMLIASLASAPALGQTVYTNDFESPLGSEWSGLGTIQAPGTLPAGSFGGGHLRNDTALTGSAGQSLLTLGGIGAHTGLNVVFDFVAWDSWDGGVGTFPQGDFFEMYLDGALVVSIAPNNNSGIALIPPTATLTFGPSDFGYTGFLDRVYRVSLGNLAHTSSTAALSFRVNGVGWQGGADESFGLDNLSVSLARVQGGIPEPSTWLTMILGFGFVGGALRRRRKITRQSLGYA